MPDSCPMGLQTSVLHRTINCHLKGGCGDETQLGHFFDCIHFGGQTSMCCPNKAYTCMQPKMPGNGVGHFMRYFYDASADTCRSFVFRGGNMVNTNVFQTKTDCEAYCRNDCPVGLMEKGKNDGPIYCDTDEDCGEKFGCTKRDINDRGVCCPLPSWICSPDGGRDYNPGERSRLEEYDVGVAPKHVTAVFYPVIRYYYSASENRCKAFMYQGEGGNFNHFETLEHCLQFCSPVTCGNGDRALVLEGRTVSCSVDEPCVAGFQCRHGVCCPLKADFCLAGYEVHFEIDDEGITRGRPLNCNHDADCPVPYVCQLTNRIMRTSSRGYCCRRIDFRESRKQNKQPNSPKTSSRPPTTTSVATTQIPTITTTIPAPTQPTESSVTMTVTGSSQSMLTCPGGRLPLIDNMGRSKECRINDDIEAMFAGCAGATDYQCAFLNVNSTIGICCQRLKYEQNRCTSGTKPLIDFETTLVRPCSPLKYDSCPGEDSLCVFDELFGDYHCCHPLGNLPIMTEPTRTVSTTTPSTTTVAATTTTTTTSAPRTMLSTRRIHQTPTTSITIERLRTTTTPRFPPENQAGCLLGQDPFQDPLGNQSLECNPNIVGTCPPGFSCHKSHSRSVHICCGVTSVCPRNSAAFINPVSQSPIACSLATGCPAGFFCFKSPYLDSGSSGICCSEDPVASLCDHGLSLRNREGKAVRCSSSTTCPRGYNCLNRFNMSICCPSSENICSQPLHTGLTCEESPPQAVYYFDVQSKGCQQFQFSGCSGNDNRFESLTSCQNYCKLLAVCSVGAPLIQLNGELASCTEEISCLAGYTCVFTTEGNYCCPKPEMTCSLPRDPGAQCSPSDSVHSQTALLWHFSTTETTCVPFEYRGCGGNFNRFTSQQHCSMSCLHALCSNGHPKMKNGRLVRCDPNNPCDGGYLCVTPKFGLPNISICCPRTEMICLQPEEKASECSIAQFRYRFDSVQERCVRFVYSGCAGSANSFGSLEECKNACQTDSSVCPKGSELYVMPDSKRAMTCSPQDPGCPKGYRCSATADGFLHFCCSEPRCPSGKMPMVSANGTGVICHIGHFGLFDECPDDYSCQQTSSGRFMCCPKAKADEACPYPSRPYLHTPNSLPMVCNEGYGTCPFGYKCNFNKAFREHFCCSDLVSREATNRNSIDNVYSRDLCDDGSDPITDDYGVVRICNPHLRFSCPDNFGCQFNGAVGRYHCCKIVSTENNPQSDAAASSASASALFFDTKEACPGGLSVKVHPKTGQPIVCQPEVPQYCPLFSRCEYSAAYWQFICCTSAEKVIEPFAEAVKENRPPIPSTGVGYHPGEAGCLADEQCHTTFSGAFCHDWVCRCPNGMKILDKTCVSACPQEYEDRDGLCAARIIFSQS
uniref:BPTI/Kunitz inhibitor domain-containing protein n=1 Tax=Panagrolaimus davidi TaxID=227884 RepID=A0A914QQP8_9BILA